MNEYLKTKIRVLSFFLVVLVVYVHSYNIDIKINNGVKYSANGFVFFIEEFFSQGLNRIASPLFFIISGYLFFANITGKVSDFISKFNKRVKTLVIPFLFWSLTGLVVYWVLQMLPFSDVFFTKLPLNEYSISKLFHTLILNPIPYQLWYVRDLTLFVILSPLLFILIRRVRFTMLFICLVLWLIDFNFIIFRSQSFFFFISGAILGTHYKELTLQRGPWKSWPLFSLWLVLFLIKTTLIFKGFQNSIILTQLHKAGIISGILAVNFMYDNIYDRIESDIYKMRHIFVYTFFIFAAHEPLLIIIKKMLFYLLNSSSVSAFFIYFMAPLITISLCLISAVLIRSYAPRLYGVMTGWR